MLGRGYNLFSEAADREEPRRASTGGLKGGSVRLVPRTTGISSGGDGCHGTGRPGVSRKRTELDQALQS